MSRPQLSAVVELLKPITWFPPMWAFACGVVASGVPLASHWPLAVVGVLLAGPLVCALMAWLFTRFDRRREADLAKLVHPRFRTRLLPGSSPRLLLTKRLLWLGCLLLLFLSLDLCSAALLQQLL